MKNILLRLFLTTSIIASTPTAMEGVLPKPSDNKHNPYKYNLTHHQYHKIEQLGAISADKKLTFLEENWDALKFIPLEFLEIAKSQVAEVNKNLQHKEMTQNLLAGLEKAITLIKAQEFADEAFRINEEKCIQKVDQWHLKIDLTDLGLEMIPSQLLSDDFTHRIVEMDIGNQGDNGNFNNKISFIPKGFGKMINLQRLNLRAVGLTSLPDEIKKLQKLYSMNVDGNPLKNLPEGLITEMATRGLSQDQVSMIEKLGSQAFTQFLEEHWDDMKTFPHDHLSERLDSIKSLRGIYNEREISSTLRQGLEKFHQFTLAQDKADKVFDEKKENILKTDKDGMVTVTLKNMELEVLPSQLFTDDLAPKIINIDASSRFSWDKDKNNLSFIPNSLKKFVKLKTLDLSYNSLTSIPSIIGDLKALTSLNVHSNKIETLPQEMANLSALKVLNIGSNNLKAVPEVVWKLTTLTELNLSSNSISSLSDAIENLTELTDLSLNHNKLTSLQPQLGSLKKLATLHLQRNQLTSFPSFDGLKDSLKELDISENQFAYFPYQIRSLLNLKDLKARYNNFNSIDRDIANLVNLESLDVSNNNLAEIPSEVYKLNLRYLNLYYNKFISLPEKLNTAFPALYSFSIDRNPLKVTDSAGNLPRWLTDLLSSQSLRLLSIRGEWDEETIAVLDKKANELRSSGRGFLTFSYK